MPAAAAAAGDDDEEASTAVVSVFQDTRTLFATNGRVLLQTAASCGINDIVVSGLALCAEV